VTLRVLDSVGWLRRMDMWRMHGEIPTSFVPKCNA
jgi:hypothetical protein